MDLMKKDFQKHGMFADGQTWEVPKYFRASDADGNQMASGAEFEEGMSLLSPGPAAHYSLFLAE
jgi:hypothetical protein